MSDFELDFFTEDADFQWEDNADQGLGEFEHGIEQWLAEDDSNSNSETSEAPLVISHIEEMVLSFMTQLSMQRRKPSGETSASGSENPEGGKLTKNPSIKLHLVDRTKENIEGVRKTKTLHYPRKCRMGSLRSFAQLFRVLDFVHEATLSGIPVTKRDIYYKDVPLFKSQKTVDTLVDDIAATFELDRSELNIRSSSKGLICGSGISINLVSGDVIHCNDTEATLIPAGEDIQTFSVNDSLAWILIVEKEAVFQTLCQLRLTKLEGPPSPGRGLIITGKGYPDVATRHLVKSLADALPRSIPILCLVDGDPYGLDILSVYKYGSKSMHHENEKLAAKRVKWLGLWASELASLGIRKDHLLPITKHDEKKALDMLRTQRTPVPVKWKKELQHMLHSRRKAEIEILSSSPQLEAGIKPSEPHALLLQYVTSKLGHFVHAAGDRNKYGLHKMT